MKLNRDALRKLPLALRIEIEENALRKELTQSELAAEQERILAALREQAAPGARTDLTLEPTALQRGDLLEKPFSEVARATAIVGELYGESHKQVEKRQAVVDAAKAEPERFGKLRDDMDRTGRVNGVYKRLKVARQAEAIRAEPPPMPGKGPYHVGVVDFPWPYEVRQEDPSHRAARPYPTMSIEQICATRAWLPGLMHNDAILSLWCTNFHLTRYAAPVLDALGFREKTILTWFKTNKFGHGDLLRSQTEQCVFAVRGNVTVELSNESTGFFAPAPPGNSRKPPEFYDFVEKLCPAPGYLDVYSRYRHNDKWDCYGDEAPLAPVNAEATHEAVE
jgi:N6-adenosine-specific RNA methylase IME4